MISPFSLLTSTLIEPPMEGSKEAEFTTYPTEMSNEKEKLHKHSINQKDGKSPIISLS